VNPNEPIALNNLAYALAVRKGQPAEAIGYAERANTLTRGNPTIADTLAWIQHLLGRDREAAQILSGVVKALPGNAEVRLRWCMRPSGCWSRRRRNCRKRCALTRRSRMATK
jgi:hypothetical protein